MVFLLSLKTNVEGGFVFKKMVHIFAVLFGVNAKEKSQGSN